MKRLAYLDGLRAIAALSVLWIHVGGLGARSLGVIGNRLVDHGKYGVSLFFVISGYTLCLSARQHTGTARWETFYLKRLLRIGPLYAVALMAAMLIPIGHAHQTGDTLVSLGWHLSLLNWLAPQHANDLLGVEWSIAVEIVFYLLFPLLFVSLNSQALFRTVLCAAMLANLYRDPIAQWLGPTAFQFRGHLFHGHMISFLLGCLASTLLRSDGAPAYAEVSRHAGLLSLIILIFALYFGEGRYTVLGISLVGMGLILDASQNGKSAGFLSNPFLVYCGKISFSIYLLHPFVVWNPTKPYPIAIWTPWIEVLLVLGAATLTYQFVERPFIDLSQRWARTWSAAPRSAAR